MATEFAVDLGGIATPANIESPIVNEAGSKAISGLGAAAHLKFANDNEDAALQLRSAKSGSTALTESELKAIQYPQLQAALDQGVLSQDEFQTRLDANLRRVYAAFPGRAKAYASFANGVRATLAPDSGSRKPQTDAEAIERARLDALQQSEQRKFEMARDLGTDRATVDGMVSQLTRRKYEDARIDSILKQGGLDGQAYNEAGLDLVPVWTGEVFENFVGNIRKTGGVVPPGQEGLLLFQAMSIYDSRVRSHLKNAPPGSDLSEFKEQANAQREGIKLLIENMGAEKVTAGEKNTLLNILARDSATTFRDLHTVNLAGGQEAVKGYLDALANPHLDKQIADNNPLFNAYASRTGRSKADTTREIRMKVYGGIQEPLTQEQKGIVGQAGANAIASQDKGPPARKLIETTTETVKEGDFRSVKAWFTPQGKYKLTLPNEDGDFYREQFKRSMDSVVASTVTELANSTGEIRLSPSGHGFEFVPSDIGTALHTAARVFGLGSTEIDRKIDLLSKYAEQHPNMVLGGSGSAAEARAQLLEDINKSVEKVRASRTGGTSAPTPSPTARQSGIDINVDDDGNEIP